MEKTKDLSKHAFDYHQAGDIAKAEELYLRILEEDPRNVDIAFLLGTLYLQSGNPDAAATFLQKAIVLKPDHVEAHNNLGTVLQNSGNLDEAVESYKRAINLAPDYAEAFYNLGSILYKQRKFDEALVHYKQAISLRSDDYEAHFNLGNTFKELGKIYDAERSYRRAIALKSDYAIAHNSLGTILQKLGKFDEAIKYHKCAITLDPVNVDIHNNLATTLTRQDKYDEAVAIYNKAVKLKPDDYRTYNNLASTLKSCGKLKEATICCNKAVELNPLCPEAHNNLGVILYEQNKLIDAISCYQKALHLNPEYAKAHCNLGIVLSLQGKYDEALSCYKKALAIKENPGVEIKNALMLPVINKSKESIKQYRERLVDQIKILKTKDLAIDDPYEQAGAINFSLVYHGLNDRKLQEMTAAFYIQVCPDLTWTSPNLNKFRQPYDKIKIGIISMFLSSHTIGILNYGIIKHLSREQFDVKVFRFTEHKDDPQANAINNSADEVVVLPKELKKARQEIASHSLDVLFYLDIGMDQLTYFLAFSRLAPVQCVTWGHPVTTGIPNVDYFISSEKAELPDAQNNYSEELVLPSSLTTYYYRTQLSDEPKPREYFGLGKEYNLYICPQTLFKFHPDFDCILGKLLRQDQRGLLVLIEGMHENWTRLLHDRFTNAFPDVIDRVKFLPRMPKNDYMSLLQIADVLLDTPYFGGGNTSLEAFACKIPLVTWPGEFLCSRLTFALYRQMGIMDCVASDAQSYIEIAYRLANDATWRNKIVRMIETKADCLFENIETVHELERFFEMAVEKVHNRNLAVTTQSVGTSDY